MSSLASKITSHQAQIVVMGVGYAGLPLAVAFAEAGYCVTAYDTDADRVAELCAGRSYIEDVSSLLLKELLAQGTLGASENPECLSRADVIVICVPTPLNKTREPEMSCLVAAAKMIAHQRSREILVVLESTTYPGTTRELLVPLLTSNGEEVGEDLFVAFSPERVDPGNQHFSLRNTPKVVAGVTPRCLSLAGRLYSTIVDEIVPVSSTETAEMAKLLENTFRAVNIGLVNEFAMIARELGVEPLEVVQAAATKPFGFMPFYPGPGLGGHCLPVDPLYLSWKARSLRHQARFVELADSVNRSMPSYVVQRLADCLNEGSMCLRSAKVLLYGVAYKADIGDARQSPALEILSELTDRGSLVSYLDPHVSAFESRSGRLYSVSEDVDFGQFDAVVILTNHRSLPAARMMREASLILDTRGVLAGRASCVRAL